MSPHEAMTTASPALIHVPVAEIVATAAHAPSTEALRHKRRGQWRSWSWADVATNSDGIVRALRERRINDRSTVAISGDYAPALTLFAIAAARAGARVVSVPISIAGPALADWLRNEPTALAFVGRREQLGKWRAALQEAGCQSEIVVDFHLPWGQPAGAGVTTAADLPG